LPVQASTKYKLASLRASRRCLLLGAKRTWPLAHVRFRGRYRG